MRSELTRMNSFFNRTPWLIAALISITHLTTFLPCHSEDGSERKAFTNKVSTSSASNASKILLIGNSLIYVGDLAGVFQALINDSNTNILLKLTEVGGPSYKLSEHITAKNALAEIESNQPWDAVIIQEQSALLWSEPEKCIESAAVFANATRSINATPLFYEIWGDDIENSYSHVHRNSKKIAAALHCDLLPVGTALYYARKEIPNINLLSDGHHLGPVGQYVAACVLYGKVMKRSPEGLSSNLQSIGLNLPKEIAEKLQNAAWKSINSEPQLASDRSEAEAPSVKKTIPAAQGSSPLPGFAPRPSVMFKESKIEKPLSSKVLIKSIMGDTVMMDIDGVSMKLKPGDQYKSLKLMSVEGNAVKFTENGIEYTKKLY